MMPDDLHTLAGAYALNALSDVEREAFERHLAECASCEQEVRALSETAARLGMAVSAPVPRSVRENVMRQIHLVRQVAPAVPAAPAPPPRQKRGGQRGLVWSLAASIAAAVILGGTTVMQYQVALDAERDAQRVQQAADAAAAVLTAPDAQLAVTRLPQKAAGTVVVSKSRDQAVFTTTGLAQPPKGKVYQLWFNDEGTMRSAGLIDPDRTSTITLLDGPVDKATGIGITLEPAGGSPQPTSPPLTLTPFPSA
ncbi:anti-sigma factor [Streptomyces sp. ISL-96]|uniref:anti-sigma factor n=1 Tax=Streptomyces sp. ISL-96 TaxID=2819191 RepID=UPI001BE7C7B4|nr:anti-sigma factor [Streptomyces sp. ISL-96]MBT2493517.1 anti-sigma factor [Streptomyces sp. ISL-96]